MKKIIVLALVLSMLAILIVPSFADSTEEEKIIEAAQKGVVLAGLLYGQQVFFDIYAIVDIENEDAEIYEFMNGLVENDSNDVSIKEYVPYEGEMADLLSSMDNVYAKSGDLIDSLDDLNSLVEKYLLNITVKTDDENTVNLIDGKKSHHPTLRKIDNEIYIHFGFGNFSESRFKRISKISSLVCEDISKATNNEEYRREYEALLLVEDEYLYEELIETYYIYFESRLDDEFLDEE